jgi:tetratricopeptide (TPR) repeat protein
VQSRFLADLGDPAAAAVVLDEARRAGVRFDGLDRELAGALRDLADREVREGSLGWAVTHRQRALALSPGSEEEERLRSLLRVRGTLVREKPPAPGDVAGWLDRGRALGQVGRWPEAITVLEELRRRLPREPAVLVALARWGFEEMGDHEKAGSLYLSAARIDPASVAARMGLVRCGVHGRDPRLRVSPETRLDLLRGLPEDDARVLVLRARALRELGRGAEARRDLERAAGLRGPGVLDALEDLEEGG